MEHGSARPPGACADGQTWAMHLIRCPGCGTEFLEVPEAPRANPAVSVGELRVTLDLLDRGMRQVLLWLRCLLVRRALQESGGVKRRAATALGVHPSTFQSRLSRLDGEMDDLPDKAITGSCPVAEVRKLTVVLADATDRPLRVALDVDGHPDIVRRVTHEVRLAIARRALERTEGNARRAAQLVGDNYTTFYSFLRRAEDGATRIRARTCVPHPLPAESRGEESRGS